MVRMEQEKPAKLPAITPPTKEQRLELVRYRLIPGHLIPSISTKQAAKLIRKNRFRRRVRRTVTAVTVLLIMTAAGYLGFQAWSMWKAEDPEGVVSEYSSWELGEWERWIKTPRVVVVPQLPVRVSELLRKQNSLFRSVLAERESPSNDDSRVDRLEAMRAQFPSGEDVHTSYTSTSSVGHASATGGTAHVSAGQRSSGRRSVGVSETLLRYYGARVRMLTAENALEHLDSIEDRLNRDIEKFEDRRYGSESLGAQTKANLRWLKNDLQPYFKRFKRALQEEDRRASALEEWMQFESAEKVEMERLIDEMTVRKVPLENGQAVVPADHVLLLEATVGSRRMVFLPGGQSEIQVFTEQVEE